MASGLDVETHDATTLFYNDWSSGKPVVLIHGWPLNADMWEYQATFLASQGLRTIAYDRPGFGRSSQPWLGYDYDTLADDLAAVLDKLDVRDAGRLFDGRRRSGPLSFPPRSRRPRCQAVLVRR